MKLLFIVDNFPPEVSAQATRTYEHCKEWAKDKTIDITIITCAPNFPQGKLYRGYKNKIHQVEYIDSIKVVRVWSYMTKNSGFFKRILDYISFAISSFLIGLFYKTDVIIATSPQFFTTLSAFLLSKLKRKPWIFEVRDLWPESIKTVGVMKQGFIIRMLEKIELGLYKSANRVVVVTNSFKQNLICRGIDENKIDIITNGSNLNLFQPIPKNIKILQNLHLENKFIVGYIGTHGLAHSLDFIVRSIADIKDKDIYFLFIGDGAKKYEIVLLSKELQLSNIIFLDQVNKTSIPLYLSICDISLVPLKKDDNFKTVIPSKIFESCAMGIPVLLGVEGESKDIITKYNSGLCFEPENKQDFLYKLLLLKKNKYIYKQGCFKLASDFDRNKLAHKMLSIIKSI
jgi:glycosyltransferase involved in cell wall biosynthesis